ncbi:hypothetical protein GGH94_006209 [Coemansia aciculifera]|uniref:Anaphase-promoting complex subunit 4 n=1 Tax=Coemansia aciculifera TaxID=417176 RepID=A0A9W8M347_9FUNG|nr:hypothetical protein GGH94_006209 [Coemansia aciculifera]
MSHSILRPSGNAYALNGFQSLSNKETLQLRTGVAPKEPKPGKHVAAHWCPSIDVLAVPEGKALRLVRLSGGQTIWRRTLNDQHSRTAVLTEANSSNDKRINEGQIIRAIAWHPTSTCVGVLHADGTLVQRDATGGDVIHESKIELEDGELVAAMEWIQCEAGGSQGERGHGQLLEHYLPRLTSADRSKAMPSHVNPTTEPLTAIIIVTAAGQVIVSLGGVFTLPVASAPMEREAAAAGSKYSVVSAKLDEKDYRLYVVFSVQPPIDHDLPATANSKLVVCALNMPLFTQTTGDLSRFTTLFARLSGLCLYMETALDVLIKESEAREETASRSMLLDSLESVLRDHGVDDVTSPEADLIRLVVTGRASESVSQFLLSKLKATKLSSWESAGRLGAVAIVRLVYQHIQPAIERAILAISELQPIIGDWAKRANTFGEDSSAISGRLAGTKLALERAVVVWGWLFARSEEYMAGVCDEQRENQEFADWALFAIDDLHWQNEGSRRVENDDGDDGSRPVRPDIDYELLLKFIRNAFHRETELNPVDKGLLRMLYARRARTAGDKELLSAYINELFKGKRAADVDQPHGQAEARRAEDDGRLEFVFHSAQVVDDALASCALASAEDGGPADAMRPTCQELLSEAKEFTLGALKWPSNMLGSSVSWDNLPLVSLVLEGSEENAGGRRVSDIRKVGGGSVNGSSCMYIATTLASSRTLELLMLPCDQPGTSFVALVDLAVLTQAAGLAEPALTGADTRVDVTDVSFFDDNLLGLTFSVGGSDSLYLGALEYRYKANESMLKYQKAPNSSTVNILQVVAIDDSILPLESCMYSK